MFRKMDSVEFELIGQWPDIDDKVLDALLCQEYYYGGALAARPDGAQPVVILQ